MCGRKIDDSKDIASMGYRCWCRALPELPVRRGSHACSPGAEQPGTPELRVRRAVARAFFAGARV